MKEKEPIRTNLPQIMVDLLSKGAEGAIEKEKVVKKSYAEVGDRQEIGAQGVVKGSLEVPSQIIPAIERIAPVGADCKYMYAILFDGDETETLIAGYKIAEVK